ncbi:hypothetical protein HPB50_010937 [Hyalomma asiaticum]|uniref:Uncharacterized protein n=1 Tax=Hyalomma asiaticum TaxID=266040 RepID=A0ACB7SZK9_HYAAI|nr:hypothetical protein HPB50_010937 [Hyalomma asiaticum]
MLECVAATPTAPWKPLFFSIYRVRYVMDLPLPDMPMPVLNVARMPKLFARKLDDVEPFVAMIPLSAKVLNRILGDCGSQEAAMPSQRVLEFVQDADEPMQKTRSWCRAASVCFFVHLDVGDHLDYAMRLTAFLAPDDSVRSLPTCQVSI